MRIVKLSDVCDISSGGTPSRNNPEYFKGDIPWAKISDIENADNGVVYATEEHISIDGLRNIRGKLFPKGTLLFSMYGSIGKVGISGRELSTNQAILGIRPRRDDEINLNYLKTWFASNKQKLINQGRGVALKNLSATIVRNLEIELPHLDDQIRIAHLLGKVEGLITQRKQHLQQLDDLLKSVFLEMFGDPIVNPRGFPVRRLSDFYISPKEGTKCGPFGSALKKVELVEAGVPVWNMDNIGPDGQMVLPFRMRITPKKYDDLSAYSVQDGDIIISRAGTVGKMCVAHMHGQPAIISTNLIRVRLGAELRPLHFVSLMLYCKGRVGRLKTGADGAFTHMNTGVLDSLEFPYPAIELQNRFAVIAEKVESIKSRYQQSLTDLEALYGALSQQAFKGELDLSRVLLSATSIEGEHAVASAPLLAQDTAPVIDLPDTDLLLPAIEDQAKLKPLLHLWLEAYRAQLDGSTFSVERFMAAAQTRLAELHPDNDIELGTDAYEHIKTWVFDQIGARNLKQTRDIICVDKKRQFGNKLLLRARKPFQQ